MSPLSVTLDANAAIPTHRAFSRGHSRRHQRGTALITSLAILFILTILAVSAMNTASLEERMSGNIQEATRAFEAAESGLNLALNAGGSLTLSGSTTTTFDIDSGKGGTVTVITTYLQSTQPKRGSGYGAGFDAANFDQVSTGQTTSGAKAVVHQGIGQIIPKAN